MLNPVPPRHWPRVTNRTAAVLFSSSDYHLEISREAVAAAPRSSVIPISELVIEQSDDGLIVKSRTGRVQFGLIEACGSALSGAVLNFVHMPRSGRHSPRITVDRLVLCREAWRVSAADLAFLEEEAEHERFLAARRWANALEMPRHVFAKIAVETKPVYVDFDSPIYVELFVKLARRLLNSDSPERDITISEMLPGPDRIWFPDSAGNTYTAEVRMIVRDIKG